MPDTPTAPTLILASRSPRRAQLLREAAYTFTQADPPFNDPPQPTATQGQTPDDLATQLASKKALSLHTLVPPNSVILAADTICIGPDNQLIGQPKNRDDARQMIRQFTQNAHHVVTGIALLTDALNTPQILADQATVTLGTLTDVQLNQYLDTQQWQGKAGGYNLFDRQKAGWPLTVQGDPTTVVGLPMNKLVPALKTLGIHPTTPANLL
jgi:nucleoside triphosphate pyrophosphatase